MVLCYNVRDFEPCLLMSRSDNKVTQQDLSSQECDNSSTQVSKVLTLIFNNIIRDERKCESEMNLNVKKIHAIIKKVSLL